MPRAQRLICWRQAPQIQVKVVQTPVETGSPVDQKNHLQMEILHQLGCFNLKKKNYQRLQYQVNLAKLSTNIFSYWILVFPIWTPQSKIGGPFLIQDPTMPPCNVEAPYPHGVPCPVWELLQKDKCYQSSKKKRLCFFCCSFFNLWKDPTVEPTKKNHHGKMLSFQTHMPGNGGNSSVSSGDTDT